MEYKVLKGYKWLDSEGRFRFVQDMYMPAEILNRLDSAYDSQTPLCEFTFKQTVVREQ